MIQIKEMKIYILNTTRFYHEDFEEYPGAWFSCPVDFEEIRERLGVQSEEEIEIEDYELPFPLEGNTRLWEINALCRMVQEMQGTPLYYEMDMVQKRWFPSFTEFIDHKDQIGLNDEYEEYAIHDYELPFEIDEYTPIEEVNRLCEMVEDLPEYIQEELSELQSYFGSIEELCEHEDDIICHSGCDDMADVARYYLEESGQLGELPAHLQNYIDYASYGRDMELDGTFVVTNHGVYEILR